MDSKKEKKKKKFIFINTVIQRLTINFDSIIGLI